MNITVGVHSEGRPAGGEQGGGLLSLSTSSPPSFRRTVFGGRGQNHCRSQNLAAAFYSTLPRINCPKTSSITKKGNCENPHGRPLPSHQHPRPPLHSGREAAQAPLIAPADAVRRGGRALH